jgi:poly(3-hydroxyalkanoate) synthetase
MAEWICRIVISIFVFGGTTIEIVVIVYKRRRVIRPLMMMHPSIVKEILIMDQHRPQGCVVHLVQHVRDVYVIISPNVINPVLLEDKCNQDYY